VNSSRTYRLAHLFLRTAALEDRVRYYIQNSKVPEEDIRKLATLDPTTDQSNGGKYLGWLINQYGDLSYFMNDMNNVKNIREMLTFYDKVKQFPELLDNMGLPADIGQVSIDTLAYAWAKYKNLNLTSEREKIKKAKKFGTQVIYDKNGYKIIEIKGNNEYAPLAACMYAKGTRWCTSDEEKAKSYLRERPLYVLFKDGQKILQTDLREFKDLENKEIDIMKSDEISQALVDSGLLSDPEKVMEIINRKYSAGAPRWPAVEPILARDPKSASDYARRRGERFELGEPAIASDAGMAMMYVLLVLHDRFPAAEETIMASPEWSRTYATYVRDLQNKKKQEQGVFGNRGLRLAYRLLRIAGLEERIQYYVKEQNIPEEVLRRLAKADPTGGKYLGWLIKNIADPQDFPDNWLDRVRRALEFYQDASKSKAKLEYIGLPGDIGQINLDQLYNSWTRHKDEDLRSRAEQVKKAKSTAKVIYSKGPYKVLQIGGEGTDPETAIQSACGYSQGTAWCTRTYNTTKGYLENGPLFLAFKGKERLFLANYRGSEIKDVDNNNVKFTDEILFLLLESELLQFWADQAYSSEREDRLFDYLVYHLSVYPHQHPEFLQYMIDHKLVSPERLVLYNEITNTRSPGVDAYIATDPRAALQYAKYVISEPWPEGEPAIKLVPRLWQEYQKYFKEELAHVE
jgi:hypothetical protein